MKVNRLNKEHMYRSNLRFMYINLKRKDKLLLVMPLFFVLASVSNTLLTLYLPKVVLDGVSTNIQPVIFICRVMIFVGLIVVSDIISGRLDYSIKRRNINVGFLFQRDLDDKSMDMDYEIYSSPSGKTNREKAIMALEGWDGNTIRDYYPAIIDLVSSVCLTISYVWILFSVSIYMIVLLILCYAISLFVVTKIDKEINKTKQSRANIMRKYNYIAEATRNTESAKDIRLFTMTNWLSRLSDILSKEQKDLESKAVSKRNKQFLVNALIVFIRDGVAYVYLVCRILNGTLSIGDFAVFFAAIAGFGNSLDAVISRLSGISVCNREVNDFRTFLESEDRSNRKEGYCLPESGSPLEIKLNHVSYTYPESNKKILDDVSITIKPYEKIALVGMNGAGKSTLVKIICGLLTPDEGNVFLNGKDIREYNRDEYFELFSLVFQEMCVFPCSIRKNVALCDEDRFNRELFQESLELAGIDNKVASLNNKDLTMLVKQLFDDATQLSGGEMQRLQLARALYRRGRVLILDEPTAALDPIAEYEIYQKYNKLSAQRTSVFISHRLASTRFCDRILLLDGAKIIESGTHDELISLGGKYAYMYNVQGKYYKDTKESAL